MSTVVWWGGAAGGRVDQAAVPARGLGCGQVPCLFPHINAEDEREREAA